MTRGQKRTLGRIIGALALFAIGFVLGGDRCGGWLKSRVHAGGVAAGRI